MKKLLKIGVIRSTDYLKWLSNPMLVKKPNREWNKCVDYTDLKKAYPKAKFPLLRIDQLVDSTSGCELMSFLDVYSGTYCYVHMQLGLKNTGVTFTHLMYKSLKNHIKCNVEAYVEDIIFKSKEEMPHTTDLQETFDNLRCTVMKLNLEKCVFMVQDIKLLGFLISKHGVKENSYKINAILYMEPPTKIKEV